ncbi:macro domain-containing protein (plasmid) [Methylomarinum sp. Ch1-1]|uniref:Macro domain-containing protein n=1 Tax=Methylomarinum roseum TaxID=3067653 RepID=A0AAU7P0E4_9GAMM|nr:macro domain-containing protein [Methylomarinum sp. Ch1-1]MDP4523307.1 macro domain-containing protein [Methylomarinum sp. Ch1-1]
MKKVYGDLIQLAKVGQFDVIVHGCNCFCTMGAGIALDIKQQFPEAYKADLRTNKGERKKLGGFSHSVVANEYGKPLIVVNAYTQYHYGRRFTKGNEATDYRAIKKVFGKIREQFGDLKIGYPKIGAGLAGGDWSKIEPIIDEAMIDCDHTLVLLS